MKVQITTLLCVLATLLTFSGYAQGTVDTLCGANTDQVQVCIGDVCSDAGVEVCVPTFIGQFDALAGIQFRLAFDSTRLAYTRFTAANARLEAGSTVLSPGPGLVSASWNDPDLTGLTFPPNEAAFEFCFNVLDTAATPITFFEPDVTLRAFDILGVVVEAGSSPGSINQNCNPVAPTCNDGIMNGEETGIDCGGPCVSCTTSTDETGMQDDRFTVSPNPLTQNSILRVDLNYATRGELEIIDSQGRVITKSTIEVQPGVLDIPLSFAQFPRFGTYVIQLTTERERFVRKVLR
ncbi:T9SS type A sorting domain-containing protein [Lewinella sp. 4G2]|uniref:T9SS type A sorting domain-containing protein n=1 Tax=Lewinella sp. 4G2 TaxID=1803372 RepID=UPI0007B4E036|nr:T9SS type A sorting domain-containing protein [Lewinella sp. 4G2]OAV43905.1 hypothetical protein A3850_005090 [Lewinella sp. 4G2]